MAKKTIYVSEENFFIVKSKPNNWRKVGESKYLVTYRGTSITNSMNREMEKLSGGIRDEMGNIKQAVRAKPGYILKYD